MKKKLLLVLLLFTMHTVGAQTSLTLSKQQMFADFDTLSSTILKVSPQLFIKRDLWNYDASAQLKKLRKSIDTISTDFSFYLLLRNALNTAQDQHTGVWGKQEEWAATQHQLFIQKTNTFRFSLPNLFINDRYIIQDPFMIGKDTIKIGTEVAKINGQKISDYITSHISDEIYQYSIDAKKFYYPGFFRNLKTLFSDSISLTFKNEAQIEKTYTVSTRKFTKYLPDKGIRNQDTTRVEYWPDEKILYVRLTEMNPKYIPYLKQEIGKYKNQTQLINKIILDFRNNGGGSDRAWTSLYAEILPENIIYRLKIDGLDNGILTKEKIEKAGAKALLVKEQDPLLKKYPFTIITNSLDTIKPSSTSLNFKGKVFILAEDYYSSAGSAMAIASRDHTDNLISVGRKTGYFLGVGFSPEIFVLPNTKLRFRIAPSMEVTDAKKLKDLMFDQLEYEIPYSINDLKTKFEYTGSTSSKEYLTKHDSFIKFVLHYKEANR